MEINLHRRNAYSRYGHEQPAPSAVPMPDPSSSYDNIRNLMLSDTYTILCGLYENSTPFTQAELQQNQRWAMNFLRNTHPLDEVKQKQYKRIFNANYFFEQSCIDTCSFFREHPRVILKYMRDNGYE